MDSGHRLDFADAALRRIRQDGLYRRLRHGTVQNQHITIDGQRLINLCSNDYLGIPATPLRSGQCQSSSRLVSGNDPVYGELEDALAGHKSQQASLVFPTGYMANTGVIPAVAQKGDLILSDELNHASIIEACRLSGARVAVYGHNDMDGLARGLEEKAENKFIVTEGIFSMDGDYSDMPRITDIAAKTGAVTIVDDAHGDFVAGRDGRGVPDMFGVAGRTDIYVSSLSKALGSFGGYVASDERITRLCVNRSKPFIYTSAMPAFMARHALDRLLSDREARRRELACNVRQMADGLKRIGYDIRSQTHIIPVVIGGEDEAVRMGQFLLERGVFVQPIRYPTVPKGQARLRVSVTAWLTEADIDESLGAFEAAYGQFF